MKKYKIEIQELLSRTIEIDADNREQAILEVKEMYKKEEIVLGWNDYVNTEINELSASDEKQ